MKYPKHFCPKVFNYTIANSSGKWKPCCKSHGIPDCHDKGTFMDFWMSDQMNELRDYFLSEDECPEWIADHCKPCFDVEAHGVKSHRMYAVDLQVGREDLDVAVENYKKTGMAFSGKRFLTYKPKGLGNTCNLKCYNCHPQNSSMRVAELTKLPEYWSMFNHDGISKAKEKMHKIRDVRSHELVEDFKKNLPFISTLNIAGGEPTLMPHVMDMLHYIIDEGVAHEMRLALTSNLTKQALLDNKFADLIPEFHHVRVVASVDHTDPDKNRWMRYPTDWEDVVESINWLQEQDNVSVVVSPTWSLLNIADADQICQDVEDYGWTMSTHVNLNTFPSELAAWNCPHKKQLKDDNLNKLLARPADILQLQKAKRYIMEIDKTRGNVAEELWPWLKEI